MENELLPCPFCGREVEIFPVGDEGDSFSVTCASPCDVGMDAWKPRDETMRLWNTRVNPDFDRLKAEVERLRSVVIEALEPGVFAIEDRSGIVAPEDGMIRRLGNEIGFGALMDAAHRMWAIEAKKNGHPGSEFSCGPCVAVRENWVTKAQEALAVEGGEKDDETVQD